MANATETQAGGMDPDFSQNGHGILVRQSCKLGAVTQIQEEREAESGKHSPKTCGRLHAAHHERRNEYLRLPSYKAAEDCARQLARELVVKKLREAAIPVAWGRSLRERDEYQLPGQR